MRVITSTTNSAEQDLLTIRAGDLEQGYAELTSRLRGYEDTPTVEGALAELDWLVGLDPVKQQVRAIAAQLRVAKMRQPAGAEQPAPGQALRLLRSLRHRQDHGGPHPRPGLLRARAARRRPIWSRPSEPTWSASTSARPP